MIRALLALLCLGASAIAEPSWRDELTPVVPGGFPLPRPQIATYRFGWTSFNAAEATATFSRGKGSTVRLALEGKTIGLVRGLWRLDATHKSLASATLRPISVEQKEVYKSQNVDTLLQFTRADVTKSRQENPGDAAPKRKSFALPNMFDMHTAMLFVRSQKLTQGQTLNLVVYPTSSPYLATVKVTGREKIQVPAGKYDAIKLDLALKQVNKDLRLEPHTQFKRATAWISDDADRLLLKMEGEIFVGSVWGELERVKFLKP